MTWMWDEEKIEQQVYDKHGKTYEELWFEVTGEVVWMDGVGTRYYAAKRKWTKWMESEIMELHGGLSVGSTGS